MHDVLIIGAGPAGLMAADHLSEAGYCVAIVEQMPSPARKLLMAGRGGLNLTHSEALDRFIPRYREAASFLAPYIQAFPPDALRDWCHELGQETFVGSSGRVFPKAMKASPLLRALMERLGSRNVELFLRRRWTGFGPDRVLTFNDENGERVEMRARAVLLGLGGASWPKLGATGDWVDVLKHESIEISPIRPANCGFHVDWSDILKDRFAGAPLKGVVLSIGEKSVGGEAIISQKGLEGGVVYALSAEIRDVITASGSAEITLDLRPDSCLADLETRLSAPRRKQSASTFLRKSAGLSPVQIALLREAGPLPLEASALAARIKSLPLTMTAPYDINRAISTAGGISLDEVGSDLMLTKLPGVFVAGEMLDWEAPTGGYLLQACFATGLAAAKGISAYLDKTGKRDAQS
ncbi:NAD(P)/FAD-dependent oxidoreductase [Roseibium sp.]|uniref:NAD(P)/FAD-dependent oxidoreductase n=1 Tax=Roseibium sp. TaxID=1936156 RepID=UPI003A9785F9